ncbi:MAG TPA: UDP-N-acetylmuramoyl-L-alanine--D-glutamate ligase [Phycisphaerae bacterium]|nr:UDP-N-acetylmuramoyl-L-alanine--D-glutamate ligase [Phycisphaerae bacterium]
MIAATDRTAMESGTGMEFAGKRVIVMGLGRFGGGIGVTRWLCRQGAKVEVTDLAQASDLSDSLAALKDLNITTRLGGHDESTLDRCDLLVVNPGVDKKKSPFFKAAMARGIPWTSEMNLFMERCPGRIIGVTGTVGKSTTTAMIGAILETAEKAEGWWHGKSWLGGNIGKSLLDDLPGMSAKDLVVLELSSFQLEDAAQVRKSPHIALVTNVRDNHLDRHGTLEEYARAKGNIYKYQKDDDWLILPFENGVEVLPGGWEKHLRVWRFGVDEDTRRVRWAWPGESGRTMEEVEIPLSVPGVHNVWNAAGAMAVSRILGVADSTALGALAIFNGLPHRLEFVREFGGVKYYNDSKATTPEAAMTSLRAFDCGVVILLGGSDKGSSFDGLGRLLADRAKAVICMGATQERIAEAAERARGAATVPCVEKVANFAEAVNLARDLAEAGDVVVLSPACASFDWFKNYEHRGEIFKRTVMGW